MPEPDTAARQEAAAAAVGLAEAWERFWAAVRALEAHNRANRQTEAR